MNNFRYHNKNVKNNVRRYTYRMKVPLNKRQWLAILIAALIGLFSIAGFFSNENDGTLSVMNAQLPVADKVLVDKSKRKMWLIANGKKYREYSISLGDNPIGHKQQEGDERTPEGLYRIDYRNPKSRYHLSLHISYPDQDDQRNAQARGVSPGGDIFIHGLPNGFGSMNFLYAGKDWTDGCIAVSNEEIKEIWKLVKNGTPIEILP